MLDTFARMGTRMGPGLFHLGGDNTFLRAYDFNQCLLYHHCHHYLEEGQGHANNLRSVRVYQ